MRLRGLSPSDVEDLVQEVFARAFSESARSAYDGLRPYRNYLYAIARNLAVQRARGAPRHTVSFDETSLHDELHELHAIAPSPERILEARHSSRSLRVFVRRLAPDQRQVFVLRFAHDYSAERIAQKLGWSSYRVKQVEQRLRKSMRRWLG